MISDVAFGRPIVIAWRRFNTASSVAEEIQIQVRGPVFLEKFLNYALRGSVVALSEMLVTDSPFRICNVERRPVLIVKVLPDPVVVVHHDWIGNTQVAQRRFYVRLLFLKRKLWGVHTDHDQSCLLIFRCPTLDIGQRSQTVDAGICPEIDEHNLSPQRATVYRGGIEPGNAAIEIRHGSVVGKE